ncbi:MAG: hypothetical protein R3C99_21010 [Pirellulaceae bacterium]
MGKIDKIRVDDTVVRPVSFNGGLGCGRIGQYRNADIDKAVSKYD